MVLTEITLRKLQANVSPFSEDGWFAVQFSCRINANHEFRDHALFIGVRGWKYSIRGNNIFMKASIRDNNFFLSHITHIRQDLFRQKQKTVQGVADGCIYLEKNDSLWTILPKHRFYPAVALSRCW